MTGVDGGVLVERRSFDSMYCWGSTVNGELGLGGIEEEHVLAPRLLEKPWAKDVVQIASGDHHTVFVTKSGRIYSCGSDDAGQLGHRKETRKRPEKIDALEDHEIIAAACGGTHTLAVNSNGQVFVWGSNQSGQLGLGKKAEGPSVPIPTFLRKLADKRVVQVSAGDKHSVALTETGEIYTWGSNTYGQLGLGRKGGVEAEPTLIASLVGVPIRQIACGSWHTLLLTKSGGVFAFGRNQFGQLGINDDADRHFPSLLRSIRSQRIAYVTAGGDHTVTLTKDGGVFTFGAGMYGQLGHGTSANKAVPHRVVELMGSEVTQVACGRRHTLAFIASRGRLYAFGLGGSGQLGNKTGKNSLVPVTVPGPWVAPNMSNHDSSIGTALAVHFRAVYSGGDHTFVSVTTTEEGYQPLDFRKSPAVTQILTLGADALLRLQNADAKNVVTQLDSQFIEKISSSASCLNGSFLLEDSHYGCGSRNVGIDAVEVMQMWDKVAEIKSEELQKSIRDGICRLISTLPSSPPDVEAMRVYVILPLYREFLNVERRPVLQIPFAESLLGLPPAALRVVELWYATVSLDLFHRLVQVYKSVVIATLKQSKVRSRTQIKVLRTSLGFLKLLNELVKAHRLPVKPQEFYIPELVEHEDVSRDYIRARFPNQDKNLDDLHFCDYPFVFDAGAKTILLQTDAAIQMHSAMNDAHLFIFPFPHVQLQNQFLVFIVTRENIVQDTLSQLLKAPAHDLKKPLRVVFAGEEAVDAGGVRKEFFFLLMRELLNPKYGMFYSYPETNVVWFSEASFEDNSMYFLVGVICGLAIYNFTIIDLPFPLAMYKKLLSEEVGLSDIAELSPTLERTLTQLVEYDGEDVAELFGLSFEITREVYGEVRNIELKPDGANIPVSNNNRREYVELYVKYILDSSIEMSFSAFSQGFHYVCGSDVLSLFKAEELMSLVVGNEDYDWQLFEKNAEYKHGYTKDDQTIKLFWTVFHTLSLDEKKRFLKFLTGTDRVPILGMKAVKIFIQPTGGGDKYFPVAHTCFNLLDLPRYKDEETVRKKLLWCIHQTEGFTLA